MVIKSGVYIGNCSNQIYINKTKSIMLSRVLGIIIFIGLLPIIIFVLIVLLFDDGFPILYKQKRLGKNNIKFWIYKFRTMRKNTPDIPTDELKDGYLYYTKTGPTLRKFSIDEIPQLINIINGDMVFIGPRPALHNQNELIKRRTKAGIQLLKPGITGWAQVNGRDTLSITEKVIMDKYYIDNRSMILNIKILFLTVIKVFKADNVKE